MKMMSLKCLLTTVILTLLFSGCYGNAPIIDLISPPKLTAEQNEIFNALINTKGSALTLKYPKAGEFLSAFVFLPETDNRVMVFYELSDSAATEPTVTLTFLEKRGDGWVCTRDISFVATDIEGVEFSRLGDSEKQNIIISYSVFNPFDDINLRVIAFDGEDSPETVYSRTFCMFYELGDFDGSGEIKLLTINQSRGDITEAMVEFAGWQSGTFRSIATVDANPNAINYIMSVKSVLQDGRAALFLEYSYGDNNYNTGIIVFDEFGLPVNVVYSRNEVRRTENLSLLDKRRNAFTALAYSRDIDGDGTVKAAGNGNRPFPGYDHASVPAGERARATIWYYINDRNRLERLYYSYLSINNDYVFFFPEEWAESVTLTINTESGEVAFWEYDSSAFTNIYDVQTKLLSIVTVPKGEERPSEEYSLFNNVANEQFDYYVRIYDRALTRRELREALRIFRQGE
jgi:hypothetical protein